jgi:hypothetical protein
MNTIGKIAIYASGFVAGSSLGYLLTKWIEKKKLEEEKKIRNQIIDEATPINYTYMIDDQEVTKEEYMAFLKKKEETPDNGSQIAITEKDLQSSKNTKDITDYNSISTKSIESKEPLNVFAAKHLGESVTKELTEEALAPYIIAYAEFISNQSPNKHVAMTYYEGDKTLADETEVKVTNPEELVGPNALDSFGKMSDDPDIVYVRNNKLGLDIEVARSKKSYNESVLGLPVKKEKEKEREKEREVTRGSRRRTTKKEEDDIEEE